MPKNCSKDRPPVWSVPGPLPGGDVRAGGRVSSAPSLSPAEEAAARLARDGYDAKYGARPLRRVIQRTVEDALSEELIAGRLKLGDTARLTLREDQVAVERAMPEALPEQSE